MDQNRLRAAVDELPSGYASTMWRYTLDFHEGGTKADNTLPYMPVVPESVGLELTASSLLVDVGCLGGHGLYDFARRRRAEGKTAPRMVGIDVAMDSLIAARQMANVWRDGLNVEFACSSSERLGLARQSCEIIIARLLLPYVPIQKTLEEFMEILRPGGLLVIQVHTPDYYRHRLRLRPFSVANWAYHSRPLLSGAIFNFAGLQPTWRRLRETAVTLKRLLALPPLRNAAVVWRDSDRRKPIVVLRKKS